MSGPKRDTSQLTSGRFGPDVHGPRAHEPRRGDLRVVSTRRGAPRSALIDHGAAAVEFALVLPLVLFILFGVIDFGRAYMAQIALTQAAREGVRVAALDPAADVEARVDAAATPLDPSKVAATVVTSCAGAAAGSNAEVKASMTFEFVTPIGAVAQLVGGSASLGNNINLVGRGVMRCYG